MKKTMIGIVAGTLSTAALAGGVGYWLYSRRRKMARK